MRFLALALLANLVLAACQTSNLTYATASGASAIGPIYRDQALSNFANLLDQPNALPSQVALVTGTMQANSSITPSVTFPLSSMFARAVAATTTETTTTAGAGSTIQGSLGFQLNYVVAAPTDTLVLRNLRAIYMAALCKNVTIVNSAYQECRRFDLHYAYTPPRMFDPTSKKLVFDPYYLEPPLCILCLRSERQLPVNADEGETLDVTAILDSKWLYWVDVKNPSQSSQLPTDSVPIGEAGGRRFYARSYADFAEFILTTLPLPPSPARPASSVQVPPPPKGKPAPPAAPSVQIPGSAEGGLRPNILIVPQVLPPPGQ